MSCKVSKLNVCYLVDETFTPIKLNFSVDVSQDELIYKVYRYTELEREEQVTDFIQVPQSLKVDQYYHELIWTRNGIKRVVFQGNIDVIKKGADKCSCTSDKDIIINVDEYTVNIELNGSAGGNGIGLNYEWRGTELGIKREDETEFEFVDLKGENSGDLSDLYHILDEEVLYKTVQSSSEDLLTDVLKIGQFNNEGVVSSAGNWRYAILNVKKGEKYLYKGFPATATTHNIYAFLKTEDNSLIPLKRNTLSVIGYVESVIDIPEDGTLMVDSRFLTGDYVQLTYAETFDIDISGSLRNYIDKVRTEKIYTAIGDSITWASGNGSNGKGYTSFLQDWIEFKEVVINGYSGLPLTMREGGSSIIEKSNTWKYSDIYSLLCGTNDFKLNTPLGTQEDYINNTGLFTFYGALRKFVDTCFLLNIKCYIVLIATTQRNTSGYTSFSTNTAGHKLRDYLDAMEWVSDRESLKYVDLYKSAGINMININTYTTDGLHPNELGYEKIAKNLKQTFLDII